MTYMITDQCIQCRRCESICPTGAIVQNEHQYQINAERCNDCVGHYAVPQCWASCPTASGCIPLTPAIAASAAESPSYWDTWFNTYNRLVSQLKIKQSTHQSTHHQPDYWHHWFDLYSQTLSQLQPPISTPVSIGVNA